MTCLRVRDRLPDFALGLLTSPEATEVERHLAWCPGCRKEAADLQEGAVQTALALPLSEPPPSLENRVVNRVQFAAGRIQPVIRRRRALGLVAATLVAALLAVGGFGWALAERSNVQTLKSIVQQKDVRIVDLYRLTKSLTLEVKGSSTMLASLVPAADAHGQGEALIYTAPGQDGFVGVNVSLPNGPSGQPYTVQLVTRAGVISVGRLRPTDTPGDWQLLTTTTQNLANVTSVAVIDGASQTLLTGTFPTASS